MSQRKALIASVALTLILAFSAIGIRAWMDNPIEAASTSGGNASVPILPQAGAFFGDDEAYEEEDDDDDDSWSQSFTHRDDDDDHDDDDSWGDDDHEDDDDDD